MSKKIGFRTLLYTFMGIFLLQGSVSAASSYPSIAATTTNKYIFIDVSENNWAGDAIRSMAERNIIAGNPDGTFHPADPVTREQFAKLVALTFGLEIAPPETPTFSDLDIKAWSYAYVEAAKPYMTGYFPRLGKPFFDPKSNATREDVAVALVRALDLSTEGIDGESIVSGKFDDVGEVSPQLINDVAVAVQNKLISGYPDGTFRPQDPIDRASVASLLYRILKTSYTDASKEAVLDINMPDKVSSSTLRYSGTVTKGAKLFVNDRQVDVTNGSFNDVFYLDKGEDTYELVFKTVLANGKSRTVTKKVTYQVVGPKLTVQAPATSSKPTVKITGKLTDDTDQNPVLTLNNEDVYVSYDGSWSKEVKLAEGNNTFTITATNKSEKQTTLVKQIVFTPGVPSLLLDNIPDTTANKTLTLSGTATDANDNYPKIYMDDQLVGSYGSFTTTVTLKDGENVFHFKAVNNAGKSSEVITKTVTFSVGLPVLKLDYLPETTGRKTLTISGSATDGNDSYPKIYMNDQLVGSYGSFTTQVTLKEGDNVFRFKALNSFGKNSGEITKTVKFEVGVPELKLDPIAEKVSTKTLTLSGSATDGNDSYPKIYMNDQLVGSYGSFNTTVTLKEGDNVFRFKAVNNLGKSSAEITKTVKFEVGAPELKIDFVAETVAVKSLTITGSATDANDSYPKIYMNDQLVGSYGSFSTQVTLKEGENVFHFKATNSLGKTSAEMTKTVTFNVGSPVLKLDLIPETVTSKTLTLSGTATDANDSYPKIYMNAQLIGSYGYFSTTVTLVEGENVFRFKATNNLGKTTEEIVKKVVYTPN